MRVWLHHRYVRGFVLCCYVNCSKVRRRWKIAQRLAIVRAQCQGEPPLPLSKGFPVRMGNITLPVQTATWQALDCYPVESLPCIDITCSILIDSWIRRRRVADLFNNCLRNILLKLSVGCGVLNHLCCIMSFISLLPFVQPPPKLYWREQSLNGSLQVWRHHLFKHWSKFVTQSVFQSLFHLLNHDFVPEERGRNARKSFACRKKGSAGRRCQYLKASPAPL